jgi:hypothetical protein
MCLLECPTTDQRSTARAQNVQNAPHHVCRVVVRPTQSGGQAEGPAPNLRPNPKESGNAPQSRVLPSYE